jgi:hypothetical protein
MGIFDLLQEEIAKVMIECVSEVWITSIDSSAPGSFTEHSKLHGCRCVELRYSRCLRLLIENLVGPT